jgi:D-sedoheptulose 7-phosphate isomerase
MKTLIKNYLNNLTKTINALNTSEIETFINVVQHAKECGNTIFIMGNGGSAATASHIVCDLNKGSSLNTDKRFKVICLNDNVPTMMAWANDNGYDEIFVEQLKNFLNPNDVVIGISGSGNSKNVLKAIEYANSKGAVTIGWTGYDGGILKRISKYSINANINNMQISEDIHMILDHLIMSVLCEVNVLDRQK